MSIGIYRVSQEGSAVDGESDPSGLLVREMPCFSALAKQRHEPSRAPVALRPGEGSPSRAFSQLPGSEILRGRSRGLGIGLPRLLLESLQYKRRVPGTGCCTISPGG